MGLAEGASSLFGPPTPVKETVEEQKQRRREDERKRKGRRSLFKEHDDENNRNVPDTPKRSKRQWAKPCTASELQEWLQVVEKSKGEETKEEGVFTEGGNKKRKSARCCSLDCVARFCSSTLDDDGTTTQLLLHNPAFLRREQSIFGKFEWEKERKRFVIEHVPLAKLSRGSMMAANTPVCNLAFQKFFGVSGTLISACKGTARARASSCADRYESHTTDS